MTAETFKKEGLKWVFPFDVEKAVTARLFMENNYQFLYLHNNIFTGELMNCVGMILVRMTIKVYRNQQVLTINVQEPNYSGST